jgi:hypothetical protein
VGLLFWLFGTTKTRRHRGWLRCNFWFGFDLHLQVCNFLVTDVQAAQMLQALRIERPQGRRKLIASKAGNVLKGWFQLSLIKNLELQLSLARGTCEVDRKHFLSARDPGAHVDRRICMD